MRVLPLFTIALFVITGAGAICALENDQWLGHESRDYSLELRYGLDNQDSDFWRIELELPGPEYSEFTLAYADFKTLGMAGDQTISSYALAWNSDPYANWLFSLAYEYSGKSNLVEVTEYSLGLGAIRANWFYQVRIFDGDIHGYARARISQLFPELEGVEVDRNGFGASVSYIAKDWSVQLNTAYFDYSRDLSNVLSSRLFILAFDDAVLSQILLLTNWDMGLGMSWYLGNMDLDAGVNYYENVVSADTAYLVYAGARYALGKNLGLGVQTQYQQEDSAASAALSLSFNW